MSLEAIQFINSRRVTRHFQNTPVSAEDLWTILRAARWAPAASNIRLHRYVCITDRSLIEQIKMVSPGIAGTRPAAIIAVCVDRNLDAFDTIEKNYHEYIDAGTATENMLLAAHALNIGACPATLDSPNAVQALLNTPSGWTVEMFVLLGYPQPAPAKVSSRRKQQLRVEDLVQWGAFPG